MNILTEKTYENLDRLQAEKADIMMKLKYFDYIRTYFKNNAEIQEMVSPSSMGIDDPALLGLISQLSELYAEKADLEINSKKDNPYLSGIRQKIEHIKRTLIENIDNLEHKNNIRLEELERRIAEITRKVRKLPVQKRQLFTRERKFDLYNQLYTYLLKKRAETEISKAAYVPAHEVIDKARLVSDNPVRPNPKKAYMIALLLGLLLPGTGILLLDYFNDKITDHESIEKITDLPVLGYVAHNKVKTENVVLNHPRSSIAEAFRSLRTNFQFIAGGEKVITTLVTSASQGEGKSFVSLNLATSFAMYKSKTVLVSFDMRRPNLYQLLSVTQEPGLSEYLSSNCEYRDIIYPTGIDYLDMIPSGTIPPNPSELIALSKTRELFEQLRKEYSYIVLDTPPVGLVTDAFLLVKYTQANLFVVRHSYTSKRMLESMIKNLYQKKIQNVNMVINDIRLTNKRYEYQYGSYYHSDYYQG